MDKDKVLVKDVVFPVFQMKEDFKQSRLIKYMEDESIPASKRLGTGCLILHILPIHFLTSTIIYFLTKILLMNSKSRLTAMRQRMRSIIL